MERDNTWTLGWGKNGIKVRGRKIQVVEQAANKLKHSKKRKGKPEIKQKWNSKECEEEGTKHNNQERRDGLGEG